MRRRSIRLGICLLLAAMCMSVAALAESSRQYTQQCAAVGTVAALAPMQPSAPERQGMQRIASYSTAFVTSSQDRCYNIALATAPFDWLVVEPGQSISFNAVVGPRTHERGFRAAKVIVAGEYVSGVGGGVCQVSTTLYNAWIRAGLCVEQVRGHSLPASYCAASLDATVSECIDLVMRNDSTHPVTVHGVVKDKKVTFEIYGTPSGYTYEIESKILQYTPPPPVVTQYVDTLQGLGQICTDEQGPYVQLRAPKQGLLSEAWTVCRAQDGRVVYRNKLRSDRYLGMGAIYARVGTPMQVQPT